MASCPLQTGPGPWLLDGGMGAALLARGVPAGTLPDQWNLDQPDIVREIHSKFLAAGSHVIQTNTFGASRPVLCQLGLEGKLREINAAAVQLAREAVDAVNCAGGASSGSEPQVQPGPEPEPEQSPHQRRWVTGNIGPSRTNRRETPATETELEDAFAEQATILVDAGVNYLAVESMTHLGEALCALRGALSTGSPVTICLTLQETPEGFFTPAGDALAESIRTLSAAGPSAIGLNCCDGSAAVLRAIPTVLQNTSLPVIAKPNAGLPEIVAGKAVYTQTPADFAEDGAQLARLGVAMIGGCCGADARFVRELRRVLD